MAGTGLKKQQPQKRRVQRPSGEQDMTVGSAPRFSQLSVRDIRNVQSITSHAYIKSETASRGGFALYKDANNRSILSVDMIQVRGNWKINATSIYTGTEDHSGYTANAGNITIYSDASNASIHAKNFYINESGNMTAQSVTLTGAVTATSGAIGGWTINSTSIYTGTEDHAAYTGATGDITLYAAGGNASIHANKWYIDINGKLFANTGSFAGAISSSATITGGIFQTASSGQRIVIDGTSISYIPSSGATTVLSGTAGGLLISLDCKTINGHFFSNGASGGSFYMEERANADGDFGGYGQFWTKSTAPCRAWFTDDTGVDHAVCIATGGTGGSGSAGAGNQYVEIRIGTTKYKVLHDGTV